MKKIKDFLHKNGAMLVFAMLIFAGGVMMTGNTALANSTLESSSLYTNAKTMAQDVYQAVASISTYVAIAMAAICLLIGQFSTDPQRIKQFRGIAIGIGVTWAIIMMLGWIFSAIYPYISSGTTFTTG